MTFTSEEDMHVRAIEITHCSTICLSGPSAQPPPLPDFLAPHCSAIVRLSFSLGSCLAPSFYACGFQSSSTTCFALPKPAVFTFRF